MSLLDTPVREVAWAAIDFEGTGTAPGQSDEAVQVGIAVMGAGFAPPQKFFRSYVRPEGRLTRAATAIHRITDRNIADAPRLPVLWPEIKSRLTGAVVVAHGAGTEKRFLRAFPMHGFGPWIDTLALSRALMPALSDHSLSAVVASCGLEPSLRTACPDLDWHDALFDAVACLVLLHHCVERFDLSCFVVGQIASADAAAYHRGRALSRAAHDAGIDCAEGEC
jgi:DNA polymerase-3 subunit epsilon